MPDRPVLPASPHEPPGRPTPQQALSDRRFGLLLAAMALVLGIGRPLLSGATPWWPAAVLAGILAAAALAAPALLAPLNRSAQLAGRNLRAALSVAAMAALFFGLVTPLAAAMRLSGRRPLALRRDASAATYWIPRDPPGPSGDSLRRPF
ncbi:hypothetical protein SAMN06265365_12831 [Tistlia consotensis]|uniref:Uncharacterized protein n=1 Tax=Tistlia consotensis USBA 355 TaxID=560819 RepID=A0A1Y6CLM5_9PROT|nr:hypothetical protein [Tistlia consotensis]SMF71554.1 hypothetical protein SAMN05428998_13051 [Tistlia consotensis USBA 355]SNS06414.1 hypothetical protein SAMN06265365_12831 [Tistlia consotensis]